jgi:DNA polymerase I-like protein with 3'-5' exonuclease and polymerase domains
MQQIPRAGGYRACFRAEPGNVLVKADYATLQMRIAADLAPDPAMCAVFRQEAQGGPDVHTATAMMLLDKQQGAVTKADRQIAKSAGFGLLFGMSARGLQIYARMTYGVEFSEAEAAAHRRHWLAGYPGIAAWHDRTYRERPSESRSRAGRRRLLPKGTPATFALNSPVQGVEADGAKLALALLWERRSDCPTARPILFNHDEIVVEVPEEDGEAARVWLERAMTDGMSPWLGEVPVKVEGRCVRTWGD